MLHLIVRKAIIFLIGNSKTVYVVHSFNAFSINEIIYLFLTVVTHANCKPQIQVEISFDGIGSGAVDARKSRDAIKNSSFIFYYG